MAKSEPKSNRSNQTNDDSPTHAPESGEPREQGGRGEQRRAPGAKSVRGGGPKDKTSRAAESGRHQATPD